MTNAIGNLAIGIVPVLMATFIIWIFTGIPFVPFVLA